MDITLSIITVNYNGLADTCALIDSITFTPSVEVIVVDNGSKENEARSIGQRYKHHGSQIQVIRSQYNLGFAGGNNIGIKAARGKYIYLVNNDTVFRGAWTTDYLIKRLESAPNIGMVCPKIKFAWEPCPIQFAGYTPLSPVTLRNKAIGFGEEDYGQYDQPHPTPYAHGAAMMLKKEILNRVGFMPECFFLYYEELDWSLLITNAGYEIWYEPASVIYHKESQSTGQNSPLRTYYLTRNRLLLAQRHLNGACRYLSYFYQVGLVAPRDFILQIATGHTDLARATLRGIIHFIKQSLS